MATAVLRGDAVAYAKTMTTTVTGVWATSDTASVTIGGKTLTVTIGSAVTVTDVAAAVVAAFNGADAVGDETRNFTGDGEPEFNEITASNVAGALTFTGDTAGNDFVLSVSESTAGTGSMGSASVGTSPEGDNALVANNIDTGTLPGAGDTFILEDTDTDLLYNLDSLSGTLTKTEIRSTYTGDLGLPNEASGGYRE